MPDFARRFAIGWRAELPLLLTAFALNGLSYLPMMTLPWFVSGLSAAFGLSATRAGLVGTLLLGVIAVTTAGAALRLTVATARIAGFAGGALAAVALGAMVPVAGAHAMAPLLILLLLGGVGFGIAAASANVLLAASADPVRLNGGLWFLMVLWQIVVWAGTPFLAAQAPLAGVIEAQIAGAIPLLLLILAARLPRIAIYAPDRPARGAGGARSALSLLILAGVVAFWLRDGITWSLVDRRAALLGVAPGTLALTLTSASLIALAGPVITLAVGERFGRLRTIAIVQALACVVLFAIAEADRPALYCGALLLWSGISVLAWTYMMGLAAVADDTGRTAAACGGLLFGASALGPMAGGLLIDRQPASLPLVILALGGIALATSCYAAARLAGRAALSIAP